jgi:predicted TIM-barrel fold metal-dependent hydrolase
MEEEVDGAPLALLAVSCVCNLYHNGLALATKAAYEMNMSHKPGYPKEVVDPHHHFIDTINNPFQSFLKSLAGDCSYLPDQYSADVIVPLNKIGVNVLGTVHVEAMPDDGASEVSWVEKMMPEASYVKAYVGSCDLTLDNVEDELQKVIDAAPGKVRGIRWILDCVGKFEGGRTATHPATLRHDGIDYLKSPNFERGLAKLEKYNLSFDLQCAPVQLVESAAALIAKYPNLKVCIDHLGKPRRLLGNDLLDDGSVNMNTKPCEVELEMWRSGMKAMAKLPNVYVKLSMMGYAIPGWIRTSERQELLKSLVLETIQMFGVNRCMVAWNWHVNGAVSDGDGASDVGPDAVELLDKFMIFFEGFGEEDRARLFAGTAKEFYRLE